MELNEELRRIKNNYLNFPDAKILIKLLINKITFTYVNFYIKTFQFNFGAKLYFFSLVILNTKFVRNKSDSSRIT